MHWKGEFGCGFFSDLSWGLVGSPTQDAKSDLQARGPKFYPPWLDRILMAANPTGGNKFIDKMNK